MERRDWGADMARELARADLQLRPSEYLALRTAAVVGAPLVTFLIGKTLLPGLDNPLALLVAVILGWWVPRYWVNRRKSKRLQAFNDHLADTITLVANALRAGASFLQAIELVVRETQPPISTEFNRVIREVNLGLPFEQALTNMVRRVRSDDLELMTTAISIQHQVGGNLAEILDSIAFTIRERIRIIGEIRVLTAQQRMSGYVVAGLPIGLMAILSVIAPGFMAAHVPGPAGRGGHPRRRRSCCSSAACSWSSASWPSAASWTSRSSEMGIPLLMALLAAGGVLLIVWALLGARTSDPVQARLTQLGTLEGVTSLEEIELQQPIMDRTLRPLMRRLSGIGTRLTSPQRVGRTESKLAEAGYPYGLRTLDFMGLKVVVALLTSGLGLPALRPGHGRPRDRLASSPSAASPWASSCLTTG